MRLRWGPYATQLAEQVVLRDPYYVIETLADNARGGLAHIFRELILRFDERPFTLPCVRCGRRSHSVCAYPGSIDLIGFCEPCALVSSTVNPRPTLRIATYEDAVRHVAGGFRRGRRVQMRRIIARLLASKGGPERLTERAVQAFLSPAWTEFHASRDTL